MADISGSFWRFPPVIFANSCAETTAPNIIMRENHIPPITIPASTKGSAIAELINRDFTVYFPET
jgi:hypothetical protein